MNSKQLTSCYEIKFPLTTFFLLDYKFVITVVF
jgi:hypothetical protein